MFDKYAYLLAIAVPLFCLTLLDLRLHLVFGLDWKRATRTVLAGLTLFILWDLLGIHLDIFSNGQSNFTTGVMLAPHFPLEELFFLTLLNYLPLLLWELMQRKRHVAV